LTFNAVAAAARASHATAAGVAGGIRHVLGCLYGADDGAADADAQAALLEALLGGGAAGFAGLDDLNLFGHDIDVALGGHDIAADLLVSIARNDVDIAAHAAHGGGCGRGAGAGLVGALHAAANGKANDLARTSLQCCKLIFQPLRMFTNNMVIV
jgi:hypothetical protein